MIKYKCNVILCGPAIGKTYLSKIDNRFIDIDGLKADYKYNLHNLPDEIKEKGKLNRGEIVNKDSSEYAINLLKETIDNNKIALITYHKKILNYINENNIPYCLVYADINELEEYASRMKKRGNSEEFIQEMTNKKSWEEFYYQNELDSKPTYKIKLKSWQYLSDIKDLFI